MKHIFLFLSLLFAVQIGTAQETWNACNSTVTIIPAPSYDSTFVLSAPSRAALAKGMASWTPSTSGGAASYLAYTALLTQSGTDAPVATVFENTLGGTVVWTRVDVGIYLGTLTGAFPQESTYRHLSTLISGAAGSIRNSYDGDPSWPDKIAVYTGADDELSYTAIEIRVYQ